MSDVGTENFYENSIELGFTNPAHTKTTKATGVNIHKAGLFELTGETKEGSPVSTACILISENDWNDFIGHFDNDKQRGNVVGITVSRTIVRPKNKTVSSNLWYPIQWVY